MVGGQLGKPTSGLKKITLLDLGQRLGILVFMWNVGIFHLRCLGLIAILVK
jgi:hypothetical protein